MNYVVPLLGMGLFYATRTFWFYVYETFGVIGFSIVLAIFLGFLYLVYQWIARITQPARCFVVVDANGKITCTNWGLNQTFTPAELAIPKTLEGMFTMILSVVKRNVPTDSLLL